mmetsp:Transcript_30549/g.97261  ORF Transcript_30549/g.97261 Transcript_30549/m.97261 type:complete len:221 (-) Transcript_30549:30-692(-)
MGGDRGGRRGGGGQRRLQLSSFGLHPGFVARGRPAGPRHPHLRRRRPTGPLQELDLAGGLAAEWGRRGRACRSGPCAAGPAHQRGLALGGRLGGGPVIVGLGGAGGGGRARDLGAGAPRGGGDAALGGHLDAPGRAELWLDGTPPWRLQALRLLGLQEGLRCRCELRVLPLVRPRREEEEAKGPTQGDGRGEADAAGAPLGVPAAEGGLSLRRACRGASS